MPNTIRKFVWAFTFLILVNGCSDGTVRTEPVEGKVTLDGKPVDNAVITLDSVGISPAVTAVGETDAEGIYRLTMYPKGAFGKGTLSGEYEVSVKKREAVPMPEKTVKSDDPETKDYVPVRIIDIVPKKYHSKQTSGLTATVVRGKNQIDFPLTVK
jgi:hypothetical protein